MKFHLSTLAAASVAALAVAVPTHATITITQQAAPAPTYDTTLNFDEPGTPTGGVASTNWQSSHGLTIGSGVDANSITVADFSTSAQPWIGTGNAIEGFFGIFIEFDAPVSSMSFQAWSPAGPPSPFGGGMNIFLLDEDGNQVAFDSVEPAWGGVGDTWYNITTTGGDTFSGITILDNNFGNSVEYMDNISWTTVPAPGALALLGLAGMIPGRRRRN